jgi:shikimate dehydrogenase
MSVDSRTAAVHRAAVLGSPIEHSLSPVLHSAAHEALGLHGWHYGMIECDEPDLPASWTAWDPNGRACR